MKRYTMWCNATHKHEMMESEQGSWVLYEDIKHLLDVQSQTSTLNLDGQDFYELCQQYRHSNEIPPHPSLPNVVQAFDNLREYIKTGKLPWPSYERTDEVHGE